MLKITFLTAFILSCSFLTLKFVRSHHVDCTAHLADQGYKFERLSGFNDAKFSIKEPIKLYSTPTTTLSSPVTLSCSFAEAFGNWAADVGAKNMTNMGGYNCRRIAGWMIMSQHSYGNAIDISMIDGVSISDNWEQSAEKACRHFTNILKPATNAAHHNHLHLDKGMGLPCWANKLKGQFFAVF